MKAKGLTKETIYNMDEQSRQFPAFAAGDTIAVSLRIKEGDKERLQVFEGDVIAVKTRGLSSSFTIRKIGANAIAVERILPYYSPLIESIRFIRKGKVRRAKLYYMRDRVGKAARVKEDLSARKTRTTIAAAAKEAVKAAAKEAVTASAE
jgi:large subunit ribosomal protein L19